jgi:hypothetical protein
MNVIAILSLAIGFAGLYTYFHPPKPRILFEIISESNVLDVHKPLEDLAIYFKNENIQENNLNLRVYTIQITNNGEADILQSYYDQNIDWGFRIDNGKIINDPRIVAANSDYLKNNLSPHVLNDNSIVLKKVILEKGMFFSLEFLVLHEKGSLPVIQPIGKIASIRNVIPLKTWEQKLEPGFWEIFFYGGVVINILRPILLFLGLILIIIVISLISIEIGDLSQNKRKKRKRKIIIDFFGEEPEDEKIKIISNGYLNKGIFQLEFLDKLTNKSEKLLLNIKILKEFETYEENLREIEKSKNDGKDYLPEINLSLHEEYFPLKYSSYYSRYSLKELVSKNILGIDSDDKLFVDLEFKNKLTSFIDYLKSNNIHG